MRLRVLLLCVCVFLFAAAIAWPATALIYSSVAEGVAPRDGFTFTKGQLLLLGRSFLLAFAAAVICLVPGILVGVVVLSRRMNTGTVAVLGAGMLCPPMIYAFGWQRLLPEFVSPELRCILVWTIWAWPLAAVLVGAGWSRVGKEPYTAALLDCTPIGAWMRIGIPALIPHLAAAFLILLMLFLGDYGVPHAFGLRVYATELLAWASESNHAIDALWAAIPPTLVILSSLLLAIGTFRHCQFTDGGAEERVDRRWRRNFVFLAIMAAGWAVPLLELIKPLSWAVVRNSIQIYGTDLFYSLGVACVSAILALSLGLSSIPHIRVRRAWLFLALLFGSLPGAVVGQAMIAAYNRPWTYGLYDSWVIVALVHVARYAWLGLLACGLVVHVVGRDAVDQARIDGASNWQLIRHIFLRPAQPLIVGVAAIIVALAMGDVAASTLVRVPGSNPIALMIIEKFHRLEDGMLVALSLMLVATALLCGAMLAAARGFFSRSVS